MKTPWEVLELIADMMPEGPRKRAVEEVMNDVLRLQTVAQKARWLALGTLDEGRVIDMRWADDIAALTQGLPDDDPTRGRL